MAAIQTTAQRTSTAAAAAAVADLMRLEREEEVKVAELESRLRTMVIEVLKPTIDRTSLLTNEYKRLSVNEQRLSQRMDGVCDQMERLKARVEAMDEFQRRLDQCWAREDELEVRQQNHQRETEQRMEILKNRIEMQDSKCARLQRAIELAIQDVESCTQRTVELRNLMEEGFRDTSDKLYDEVRRLDEAIKFVEKNLGNLRVEVWGPEDCSEEILPPSLRRLDRQMRMATGLLQETVDDVTKLKRLDQEMVQLRQQNVVIEDELGVAIGSYRELAAKVDSMAQDMKDELRRVSNMMAAFSANLMQEVRQMSSGDVKTVKEMRLEIEGFVQETQEAMKRLHASLDANSRQVEAIIKEVRTDLEGLDTRRKKDKQGLEEDMLRLRDRMGNVNDGSASALRGLEHISNVVSMSLQSERMSVALDLQDFIERRETPAKGRGNCQSRRGISSVGGADGIATRPGSIDGSSNVYKPQPIVFQGTSFERPQLLALREKLVHVAQEVLTQGPPAPPSNHGSRQGTARTRRASSGGDSDFSAVPSMNAAGIRDMGSLLADLRAGRGASVFAPRPGSRGQPSARGSPPPPPCDDEEHVVEHTITATTDSPKSPVGTPVSKTTLPPVLTSSRSSTDALAVSRTSMTAPQAPSPVPESSLR